MSGHSDSDNLATCKAHCNQRLREKYAMLSHEEKELRRLKQREAYQKRKARKNAILLLEQEQMAIKSETQIDSNANLYASSDAQQDGKEDINAGHPEDNTQHTISSQDLFITATLMSKCICIFLQSLQVV